VADRIVAAALADSTAWRRIAELTDAFGPRLSGSDALERAIDRMLAMLRADGFANVRGEPVMVPHWVRGDESAELAGHVFAMESDNGVFRPRGMRLVGSPAAVAAVAPVGRLLRALGAGAAAPGEGGADIGPLLAAGVPGAGLDVDGTRYFWYHHTPADTPDKLDPADVARCVATFAVWAYVLADAPGRPPHGPPAAAAAR
jgi:hypothetical protein